MVSTVSHARARPAQPRLRAGGCPVEAWGLFLGLAVRPAEGGVQGGPGGLVSARRPVPLLHRQSDMYPERSS